MKAMPDCCGCYQAINGGKVRTLSPRPCRGS